MCVSFDPKQNLIYGRRLCFVLSPFYSEESHICSGLQYESVYIFAGLPSMDSIKEQDKEWIGEWHD